MSKPIPPRYKTTNWASYNAALKRRGSLTIWFDPEMAWEAAPSGKRGGRQVYGDAAIQACLTLKVVFGMALRQTTGFVTSLLKLAGLDWSVPDFSTLSRRQKDLAVVLPRRASVGPMHLLIDSTGIKVEGDGEWHASCGAHTSMAPPNATCGAPQMAQAPSRPLHGAIDAETLDVQAVEVTGAGVGDAPMLPELLA